jgi:hypothetical protein
MTKIYIVDALYFENKRYHFVKKLTLLPKLLKIKLLALYAGLIIAYVHAPCSHPCCMDIDMQNEYEHAA